MLELSPYFKSLARTPHVCPRCRKPVELKSLELTWDGAMWKCDACGWCQLELAPEAAKVGQRGGGQDWPDHRARIIRLDFGGGCK